MKVRTECTGGVSGLGPLKTDEELKDKRTEEPRVGVGEGDRSMTTEGTDMRGGSEGRTRRVGTWVDRCPVRCGVSV